MHFSVYMFVYLCVCIYMYISKGLIFRIAFYCAPLDQRIGFTPLMLLLLQKSHVSLFALVTRKYKTTFIANCALQNSGGCGRWGVSRADIGRR